MAKKKTKHIVVAAPINPVKKPYAIHSYTPFQLEELRKCADDCMYFIENYVFITAEGKGSVLFKPFDYQKEIINDFLNNRNTVCMAGRQLGKSTCSASYMLWLACFRADKTILVVSNIFSAAMEIMDRIRYSYEMLPEWIKPGATAYNKGSIYFDNNSRIISRATTKNAGRGLSLSLLYADEFALVELKKQKEFWSAIRPTLATGGKCIITSTPGNDEDVFAQIFSSASNIFDELGNEIPGGLGRNGFKAILKTWKCHPNRDEAWEKEERAAMADDIRFEREHNCKFLGSEETLIDQNKLSILKGIEPLFKQGDVRWYHRPQAGRIFLISLDPSMGTGGDFSAVQVFQLPEMKQIAEWQHNKTDIPGQLKLLKDITTFIKETHGVNVQDIYWTIENNNIGEAVNIVLKEVGDYNIAGTYLQEKPTPGKKKRKGFCMTNKMKLEACSKFKTMLERDKIQLFSKPLISQLKIFIARGAGYAAKGSEHDDLVMATLLIVKMLERVMSYDDSIAEKFQESFEDNESRAQPLWFVMS